MKMRFILAVAAFVLSTPQAFAQLAPNHSNSYGAANFELDNFGIQAHDGSGWLSTASLGAGGNKINFNGVLASGVHRDHTNMRMDLVQIRQTPDMGRLNIFNVGGLVLHRRDANNKDLEPENKNHLEVMVMPFGRIRYRDGKGGGPTAMTNSIAFNGSHDFNDLTSAYGSAQIGILTGYSSGKEKQIGTGSDTRLSVGLKHYINGKKTKSGQTVYAKAEVIYDAQNFKTTLANHNKSNVLVNGTIGINLH